MFNGHLLIVAGVMALFACSPAEAPSGPDSMIEISATPLEEPPFDTTIPIHDLMRSLIAPNAEGLWKAVSYVATAEGVTETAPQTDEDWAALRANAIALIEGANALMLQGRAVAAGAGNFATPDWQFTPEEITQFIADDPQTWNNYLRQLQESTRMTLRAVELRDLAGLSDFGARINESCESCHARYWYRPQP
jgi:cytochrome c556